MPEFLEKKSIKTAIIIGGGESAKVHAKAIKQLIKVKGNDICIVHSSSKNANYYSSVAIKQFFCLVGNEGYRLNKVFKGELTDKVYKCILPAYPREMGTYIPEDLKKKTFELKSIDFTEKYLDSHFALALQTAIQIGIEEVFLVGYDGYLDNVSNKEYDLATENNYLLEKFQETNINISSLTETNYNINVETVFKFI